MTTRSHVGDRRRVRARATDRGGGARADPGVKRAASRTQLVATDVGHTTSDGAGPSVSLLTEEERERRDRLAEPHVVGEDAARAERLEELEPREAESLVRAQASRRALAASRARRRRRARAGGRAAPRPPASMRPSFSSIQRSSRPSWWAGRRASCPVMTVGRLVGERLDRRRDARERAVAERDPALLLRQRRADRAELDRAARSTRTRGARRASCPRGRRGRVPRAARRRAPARGARRAATSTAGSVAARSPRSPSCQNAIAPSSDTAICERGPSRRRDRRAPNDAGRLGVGARARLLLEIAPILRADACVGERATTSRARYTATSSPVTSSGSPARRRTMRGVSIGGSPNVSWAGSAIASPARRAEEARSRVSQLAGRNEEDETARELTGEVEIDVARDAVDRARPASTRRGTGPGRTPRRRRQSASRLHRRVQKRGERVERGPRSGRSRGNEGDRRPHGRGAKVEETLVAVGEDTAVGAHRLDGERRLDAHRVDCLPGRAAVAGVLEHPPIARARS